MKYLIIIFTCLYFNLYSQIEKRDSIIKNINSGFILSTFSAFPITVAVQTFNNPNLSNKEKFIFGGSWLSFGICLDISAVNKFYKAYKYKKIINKNEKI